MLLSALAQDCFEIGEYRIVGGDNYGESPLSPLSDKFFRISKIEKLEWEAIF